MSFGFRILGVLPLLVAILFGANTGSAAELILFETEGCAYCRKWDREVGTVYPLTEEAKILTLRRVEIADPIPPELRHVPDIRYTPTFVVLEGAREVGRIVGYLSEDQFWGLLGEIIEILKRMEKNGASG